MVVLIATFMLQFKYRGKREVRIIKSYFPNSLRDGYFVKNTGGQPADLVKNGFVYTDGKVHDFPLSQFFIGRLLEQGQKINLQFYNQNSGEPPVVPEWDKVRYIYVMDSEEHETRAYFFKGYLINNKWVVRFLTLKDRLTAII